jgi:hypothetical protein
VPRSSRVVAAVAACLAAATAAAGVAGCRGGPPTTGWTATVYYTAVEEYHSGPAVAVTGCPVLDCPDATAPLGSYPADFVTAVRDEGTGRTRAGRYLNWSHDLGFWLDDAPRDAAGGALVPFESAAADPGVLAAGTRFRVADCGRAEVDRAVCDRLRAARWTVRDEFTPGLGGDRHVDLYLGEETGPGFTDGPWYTTLEGARLSFPGGRSPGGSSRAA